MKYLLFHAKMKFTSAGDNGGMGRCDIYTGMVDLLALLVNDNFRDLPSLDELTKMDCVRSDVDWFSFISRFYGFTRDSPFFITSKSNDQYVTKFIELNLDTWFKMWCTIKWIFIQFRIVFFIQRLCNTYINGLLAVHRRLRDKLIADERLPLAMEVSTKCGLDPTGVWVAWGMMALQSGEFPTARDKFSKCLKVSIFVRIWSINAQTEVWKFSEARFSVNFQTSVGAFILHMGTKIGINPYIYIFSIIFFI